MAVSKKDVNDVAHLVKEKLELYFNEEVPANRFHTEGKFLTTPRMHGIDMAYKVTEQTKLEETHLKRRKQKQEREENIKNNRIHPKLVNSPYNRIALRRDVDRLAAKANNLLNNIPLRRLQVLHRYRPAHECPDTINNGKVHNYNRHVGCTLNMQNYVNFYLKQGLGSGNPTKSPRLQRLNPHSPREQKQNPRPQTSLRRNGEKSVIRPKTAPVKKPPHHLQSLSNEKLSQNSEDRRSKSPLSPRSESSMSHSSHSSRNDSQKAEEPGTDEIDGFEKLYSEKNSVAVLDSGDDLEVQPVPTEADKLEPSTPSFSNEISVQSSSSSVVVDEDRKDEVDAAVAADEPQSESVIRVNVDVHKKEANDGAKNEENRDEIKTAAASSKTGSSKTSTSSKTSSKPSIKKEDNKRKQLLLSSRLSAPNIYKSPLYRTSGADKGKSSKRRATITSVSTGKNVVKNKKSSDSVEKSEIENFASRQGEIGVDNHESTESLKGSESSAKGSQDSRGGSKGSDNDSANVVDDPNIVKNELEIVNAEIQVDSGKGGPEKPVKQNGVIGNRFSKIRRASEPAPRTNRWEKNQGKSKDKRRASGQVQVHAFKTHVASSSKKVKPPPVIEEVRSRSSSRSSSDSESTVSNGSSTTTVSTPSEKSNSRRSSNASTVTLQSDGRESPLLFPRRQISLLQDEQTKEDDKNVDSAEKGFDEVDAGIEVDETREVDAKFVEESRIDQEGFVGEGTNQNQVSNNKDLNSNLVAPVYSNEDSAEKSVHFDNNLTVPEYSNNDLSTSPESQHELTGILARKKSLEDDELTSDTSSYSGSTAEISSEECKWEPEDEREIRKKGKNGEAQDASTSQEVIEPSTKTAQTNEEKLEQYGLGRMRFQRVETTLVTAKKDDETEKDGNDDQGKKIVGKSRDKESKNNKGLRKSSENNDEILGVRGMGGRHVVMLDEVDGKKDNVNPEMEVGGFGGIDVCSSEDEIDEDEFVVVEGGIVNGELIEAGHENEEKMGQFGYSRLRHKMEVQKLEDDEDGSDGDRKDDRDEVDAAVTADKPQYKDADKPLKRAAFGRRPRYDAPDDDVSSRDSEGEEDENVADNEEIEKEANFFEELVKMHRPGQSGEKDFAEVLADSDAPNDDEADEKRSRETEEPIVRASFRKTDEDSEEENEKVADSDSDDEELKELKARLNRLKSEDNIEIPDIRDVDQSENNEVVYEESNSNVQKTGSFPMSGTSFAIGVRDERTMDKLGEIDGEIETKGWNQVEDKNLEADELEDRLYKLMGKRNGDENVAENEKIEKEPNFEEELVKMYRLGQGNAKDKVMIGADAEAEIDVKDNEDDRSSSQSDGKEFAEVLADYKARNDINTEVDKGFEEVEVTNEADEVIKGNDTVVKDGSIEEGEADITNIKKKRHRFFNDGSSMSSESTISVSSKMSESSGNLSDNDDDDDNKSIDLSVPRMYEDWKIEQNVSVAASIEPDVDRTKEDFDDANKITDKNESFGQEDENNSINPSPRAPPPVQDDVLSNFFAGLLTKKPPENRTNSTKRPELTSRSSLPPAMVYHTHREELESSSSAPQLKSQSLSGDGVSSQSYEDHATRENQSMDGNISRSHSEVIQDENQRVENSGRNLGLYRDNSSMSSQSTLTVSSKMSDDDDDDGADLSEEDDNKSIDLSVPRMYKTSETDHVIGEPVENPHENEDGSRAPTAPEPPQIKEDDLIRRAAGPPPPESRMPAVPPAPQAPGAPPESRMLAAPPATRAPAAALLWAYDGTPPPSAETTVKAPTRAYNGLALDDDDDDPIKRAPREAPIETRRAGRSTRAYRSESSNDESSKGPGAAYLMAYDGAPPPPPVIASDEESSDETSIDEDKNSPVLRMR